MGSVDTVLLVERSTPDLPSLRCPRCQTRHRLAVWLTAAAVVPRSFLVTRCPTCETAVHLRLEVSNLIEIGELDGFPGPVFHATDAVQIQYTTRRSQDEVSITVTGMPTISASGHRPPAR